MPQARTKHFAVVDYDDSAVITFPAGLPAFERLTRFVLVERQSMSPLVFLQSLEDEAVCLPAAPVSAVCPDYRLELTADDLAALGAPDPGELACLAVVSIPAGGVPTANLLAPVVIDLAGRRAVQAVRSDTQYSHRHPLTAREGAAACS